MRADIQVMQGFIDTLVGVPKFSYPARQDADRPTDEFAVISLLTERAVGLPNSSISSSDELTTTRVHSTPSELRFRVGLVETDGEKSFKIMHGWHLESIKQLMMKTGYGFRSCHPISLEDAKLESFWEARQGFSIDVYVTRQHTEVIDNMTSLVIGGEYIVPDLSTIALNININP